MSYTVQWASGGTQGIPGKSSIVIPDLYTDTTSTSLTLTGRDVTAYGQIQQTNFIRLLENSANITPPANSTIGQLWYNSSTGVLYVKVDPAVVTSGTITTSDGSTWQAASATGLSPSVLSSGLGYIPLSKAGGNVTGNITLDGIHTVTGLPLPSAASDVATKAYVDATTLGINIHAAVQAATTTPLTSIYTSGSADTNGGTGIGATLTNNGTQAALVIDGYSVAIGDRILVKDQGDATQNGVYTVTTVGDVATNWVLTRANDYNDSVSSTPPQVYKGDYVFVANGSQAGSSWSQYGDGTGTSASIIIGTDQITFSQFSSPVSYSAGAGISIVGNTIQNAGVLNLTAGSNILLTGSTGNITVSLNGTVPAATLADTAAIADAVTSAAYTGTLQYPIAFLNGNNVLTNNNLQYTASTGTLASTVFSGSLAGNAQTATLAIGANNLTGGSVGYLPYQSASNTTSMLSPGTDGQVLTVQGGVPVWKAPSIGSGVVTSVTAGTGISITGTSAVPIINNTGILSITGTASQIIVGNSGNNITLSLPQSIATSSSPTFSGLTLNTVSVSPLPTSYGSLAISGVTGGFAGIQFTGTSGNRTFMVSNAATPVSGLYNVSSSTWDYSWTGGTLTVGTVPASNIGAGTANINISGTAASATSSTTQPVNDNTVNIATTEFVQNQIAATGPIAQSFWTYSNPVSIVNSEGTVNWQTATTAPVGLSSYSSGTITISKAGYYFITANVVVGANAEPSSEGSGQVSLYHNGVVVGSNITSQWGNQSIYSNAQQYNTLTVTSIIYCAANDTVEIYYTSNGGFGSLISGNGSFTGFKIA